MKNTNIANEFEILISLYNFNENTQDSLFLFTKATKSQQKYLKQGTKNIIDFKHSKQRKTKKIKIISNTLNKRKLYSTIYEVGVNFKNY